MDTKSIVLKLNYIFLVSIYYVSRFLKHNLSKKESSLVDSVE